MSAETLYPLQNGIGNMVRSLFPESAFFINPTLGLVSVVILVSVLAAFLILLERKVVAHFQVRLGPMRVGYHGILQPLADGLKLLFKEILKPKGADSFIFYLAPMLPLTATFLIMVIMPFDHHLQLADPAGGVLYVLGVSGLTVLGILLGGWSSNNKLSLLGAMRAGAQMISFEISLALIMLLIVMLSGTASLREIVLSQQGLIFDWWIFKLPFLGILSFIMYLVASTAELNRTPFDLAEAESELTAGYHTEYSGMGFAMFFFAEFVNMFISAGLATTFFLGGFLPPLIGISFVDGLLNAIPGFLWFFGKTFFVVFIYMWFRWTFPRLRVDQLMSLEWKMLLPANLLLLMMGAVFMVLGWAG
ncbi:NADH-quinone oxidoreductase subunit H [Candidatus Electrothrix aarhusensis]|uniref:NADH-quinone oxidoreductase subunit H n=1 Tax=Candidatus Electrothrix aarhusensis TaxID=1859131 RepID=A0A3S3RPQ2_9BACT|nr:NADH-quinone oxidoreductase subunit H [Candidatus Electrothrix aarhusensis]